MHILNNLANLLQAPGDLAGARPLSERALAIDEKVPRWHARAHEPADNGARRSQKVALLIGAKTGGDSLGLL
jgi:hypothetical protein